MIPPLEAPRLTEPSPHPRTDLAPRLFNYFWRLSLDFDSVFCFVLRKTDLVRPVPRSEHPGRPGPVSFLVSARFVLCPQCTARVLQEQPACGVRDLGQLGPGVLRRKTLSSLPWPRPAAFLAPALGGVGHLGERTMTPCSVMPVF